MTHEVVTALLIQSNKVLLGLRSPKRLFFPGVWDVFGGHREPGEEPEQTLVRELQEELGITPTQWTFVETLTNPLASTPEEPSGDLIAHLYLVTKWKGTPINRQPEEHSVIHWFALEEAIQLELADSSYPRLFERYMR